MDCASAINVTIKKLKIAGLNMSNITFHAITGDSGGGSAVQHIHPALKQIKVMSKDSKKLNCQCHALSKAFENACIKTFGKQGIGQNSIFQAGYVYVKMIKTLHEDGGAEIVNTVHYLVTEKLAASSSWQMEASQSNGIAFEHMWKDTKPELGLKGLPCLTVSHNVCTRDRRRQTRL